jgi:type IV secretion system protein VirB4
MRTSAPGRRAGDRQHGIFLPNDRAREPRTRAFYEASGLNDRQIELIAHAMPKRDYYVVSRDGCRMIELGLGPATLAFVGASTPEDQALMDRVLAAHGRKAFARHWCEARGLKAVADAFARFEAARPADKIAPIETPTHLEGAAS